MAWVDLYEHIVATEGWAEIEGASAYAGYSLNDPLTGGFGGDVDASEFFIFYTDEMVSNMPLAGYVAAGGYIDGGFPWSPYTAENAAILGYQPDSEGVWAQAIFFHLPIRVLGKRLRARIKFFGEEPTGGSVPHASIASLDLNNGYGVLEEYVDFYNQDIQHSVWSEWAEFVPSYGQQVGIRIEGAGCERGLGAYAVEMQIQTEDLVANDDEAEAEAGGSVVVNVLANDTLAGVPVSLSDLAGPPEIVTQPEYGEVSVNPDGTITYSAPSGFSGEVEFQYRIESEGAKCPSIVFRGAGNNLYFDADYENEFPDWFDPDQSVGIVFSESTATAVYSLVSGNSFEMISDGPYVYGYIAGFGTLSQGENSICLLWEVEPGY